MMAEPFEEAAGALEFGDDVGRWACVAPFVRELIGSVMWRPVPLASR